MASILDRISKQSDRAKENKAFKAQVNQSIEATKRMAERNIFVILTGGTIGAKSYQGKPTPTRVEVEEESPIPAAIKELGLEHRCSGYINLYAKDSNDVTDQNLLELAKTIKDAPEKFIVVTHGTDKMAPNARTTRDLLKAMGGGSIDKTVVFTGSMKPLSHGEESDGHQNLAQSICDLSFIARNGIYVIMDGKILGLEGLEKDKENMKFHYPKPEASGSHAQGVQKSKAQITASL